jgi:uncharacterized BrkB/YihY/UPF0761 family membrane protein
LSIVLPPLEAISYLGAKNPRQSILRAYGVGSLGTLKTVAFFALTSVFVAAIHKVLLYMPLDWRDVAFRAVVTAIAFDGGTLDFLQTQS